MSGNGQNSIFGSSSFTSNSSGNNNTAIGFATLPSCTTGNDNIAIGSAAGATLTTGSGIHISVQMLLRQVKLLQLELVHHKRVVLLQVFVAQ